METIKQLLEAADGTSDIGARASLMLNSEGDILLLLTPRNADGSIGLAKNYLLDAAALTAPLDPVKPGCLERARAEIAQAKTP